jgi:hypothetical protein
MYRSPPPRLGAPGTRCVYLFGDPLASVASHYRRGHAHHQALKTSGDPRLSQEGFPNSFDEYVSRSARGRGAAFEALAWENAGTCSARGLLRLCGR